ncbi:MAG: DUF2336 domain-containing protein [Rhizobiales bacterium]|nr:DUF2336 domain-containing protein [Hyphomicrobiales bacterium]
MHDTFRDAGFGTFTPSTQQMRDSALLRATTDLFVQELVHDRDEIRRFEEIAIHLVPKVAETDRIHVAERLALRLDAPIGLVRLLARDTVAVAAPLLRHSPVFGPLDLLAIIAATGPEHRRLIAERAGISEEVRVALRISAGEAQAAAPVGEPVPAPVAEADTARSAGDGGRFDPWRFLALDRPHRLRLMAELATRPPVRHYAGPAGRLDRAFRAILGAAQIVGLARAGQRAPLTAAIAEALTLEPRFVIACLDDATGEPLAVLLKALGLDSIQAQQVFLLATTTVGRDVQVFFRLCDLYAGMDPGVAEVLFEAWRIPARAARPAHQPVFAENGERRRPAAEVARESARPAEDASRSTG